VKDLLAYFRLVINPADEEALKRIINYPARGIGSTSMDRIIIAADQMGKSIWEILESIEILELGLNQGIKSKIIGFVNMMKSFMIQQKTRNAYNLAQDIAKASGIMKDLNDDKTPEGISRFENIEELLNGIKDFSENFQTQQTEEGSTIKTLDTYLQDIALLTDADQDDRDDNNKVSLMTIHSAKGLEFPYVFVVGLEENLFPSIMSINSRTDLEEERRLFYVAVTRAEKAAILSYAENRYKWGNMTMSEPSRFISEIDEKYVDFPRKSVTTPPGFNKFKVDDTGFHMPKATTYNPENLKKIGDSRHQNNNDETANFEGSPVEEIKVGMQVEHQRFGVGKITDVEGNGANRKATVFFAAIGSKQLLLKYAKLRIIKA
jgi:DNA helicase-2/ATP-dependent DNA helicase PcrA